MRTVNAGMDRFIGYISDKNLYIYGIGDIYQRLMSREVYHPIPVSYTHLTLPTIA